MDSLAELVAWHKVFDLSLRYAAGIDQRDWSLYRSCFTDEVRVDFSSFNHRPASAEPMAADDWIAVVRRTIEGFESTQHLIGNQTITFDGPDRARYQAYLQAQHWMDRDHWYLIGGWYFNEAHRVDGEWKLATVVLDQRWDAGDRSLLREASRRVRERSTTAD